MLASSRLLAGRYRLLDPVGEGGMAIVHRARDELLGRDVAVKLLRPIQAGDPDFVRRFRREARHAAQLHHPHVVTIHDLGIDPATGADYIVMELVEGTTLEALLAEGRPLPLGQALRIASETAQALQAAHDRGIVHRDVKPGNILIDREGSVRVADFGIARAAGAGGGTTAGVVVGSPEYVSPEQVLGEPITPASDVYSLGVVVYQMVTGRRPFEGDSAAAVALQRLRVDPALPSSIVADLPPGLEGVIRRAMARMPIHRFPSAADLSIALDGIRLVHLGGVRRRGSRPRPPEPPFESSVAEAAVVESGAAAAAVDGRPGVSQQPPWTRDVTARTAPRHPRRAALADRPAGRRRARPRAAVLPLLALVGVLMGAVALFGPGRPDAPTGSPAGRGPVVVVSPSSERVAVASAAPAVSSPSSAPVTSPPASSAPIETRPPVPTRPARTAAPTPAPTPRPTPPATVAGQPDQTVRSFYELVARHDFDAAARLWSASMRERYPPAQYIDGRFAATTGFELRRIETVARSTDSARVAVDIVEFRSDGAARHWVGSWDLVRTSAGWLMNSPRF